MSTEIIEHQVLSSPSPIKSGEYKKTTKLFFQQSKLLEAQITDLFDDVWPTVTAWKNLRWQVMGYHIEHPDYDNNQLTRQFVEPQDKSNRPNLYRKCIQESWEDQEYRISTNLLLNTFACYEGWIDEILKSLNSYSLTRAKQFQFPNKWRNELVSLQSGGSQIIIDAFYDSYKDSNKRYNIGHLDNYLVVYRYFKECRNSIVHSGGIASQNLLAAQTNYQSLVKEDIDVVEIPRFIPSTLGMPVELSLRGVVGFTQVILNIVSTLDIEFIKCKNVDTVFLESIKNSGPFPVLTSTKLEKKKNDIIHICGRASFRPPQEFTNLHGFLYRNGIVL